MDFISLFAQPGVLNVSESSLDFLTYVWKGSLTWCWAGITEVCLVFFFGVSLQGIPGFPCHSHQTNLDVCEILVLGNPLLKGERCLWRLSSSHLHLMNCVPVHLNGCISHWRMLASCCLVSARAHLSNLFGTFLPYGCRTGWMRILSLLTTSMWSVQQSAPHIVFVTLTSCLSFLRNMT